jgi:acyl-homoserine-lactone acylase
MTMHSSGLSLLVSLVVLCLGTLTVCRAATPEVLWDTWGVPHIYAQDDEGVFYGFGWAQAESHADLVLHLYGQARGRGAEYQGEDSDLLAVDRMVRTMGGPRIAEEWYRAQNPDFRRCLDAFAAGINAYGAAHPGRISDSARLVLPVTGTDVLAHALRVIHFTFVAGSALDLAARRSAPGSNAWAIGPTRSASGHAMLLANPHLNWSGMWRFCEAHLVAPGVDLYGAALIGLPVIAIGFNDHLGWTHTVNTMDGADVYALTLAEGGYVLDGKVRPFEVERQTIKARQADGTMREEALEIRRSVHGPVVGEVAGQALALRVVGMDRPGALAEWWEMGRATSLTKFERALGQLQIPLFNVLYADHDGHIVYVDNGLVPVRSRGDWEYWSGLVPGDTSATLWTETHPYRDLPRVVDPPTGWLQNCNDSPWTCTLPSPLHPDGFPLYLAPEQLELRAQRSLRMLLAPGKLTFEDLLAHKHSTRMELADRLLDELVGAARQSDSDLTRQAAEVLARWDRQANADSRGAAVFATWEREMQARGSLFASRWNPLQPLATPSGLGDPGSAVAALEVAAREVQQAYGRLDVPWGEAVRLRVGSYDLPANGAPERLGVFRVLDLERDPDGKFRGTDGDSFVAAVEFATPVRAQVLLSYGNATQLGSPHIGDQLPLFAAQQLRPAWRSRQEIEEHLESRETLPARP